MLPVNCCVDPAGRVRLSRPQKHLGGHPKYPVEFLFIADASYLREECHPSHQMQQNFLLWRLLNRGTLSLISRATLLIRPSSQWSKLCCYGAPWSLAQLMDERGAETRAPRELRSPGHRDLACACWAAGVAAPSRAIVVLRLHPSGRLLSRDVVPCLGGAKRRSTRMCVVGRFDTSAWGPASTQKAHKCHVLLNSVPTTCFPMAKKEGENRLKPGPSLRSCLHYPPRVNSQCGITSRTKAKSPPIRDVHQSTVKGQRSSAA